MKGSFMDTSARNISISLGVHNYQGGQSTCIVLIDHIFGVTYQRDLSVTSSIGDKDMFKIERISSPNELPSYQWRCRWWHHLTCKYCKKVTAWPRASMLVLYTPPNSCILDVAFDFCFILCTFTYACTYLGDSHIRQNIATCPNPEHVNPCAILGHRYPHWTSNQMCIWIWSWDKIVSEWALVMDSQRLCTTTHILYGNCTTNGVVV
jgi:hypothetical protein